MNFLTKLFRKKENYYLFLNDTRGPLTVHSGSCINRNSLIVGELITIKIPKNTVPFIKVWDEMVLLTYAMENPLEKK